MARKSFRKKCDFISSSEKDDIRSNSEEMLKLLERDLIGDLKIAKEDVENVAFWHVPGDPAEFNQFIQKYPSVCIYWGIMYNAQYRKAKATEKKLTEYIHSKRQECYDQYVDDKSDEKGKLSKQPTKEDYDQLFLKLFGKDKKYLKLQKRMTREKEARDKLETIYVTAKQFKDLLVVSGNLQINMINKGLIDLKFKHKM